MCGCMLFLRGVDREVLGGCWGGRINMTYRVVKSCQSMFVEVLLRFCSNFKVFLK